jgi:hypothetical protein
VAGGVEAVVDPGERARPGVGVDRVELPVPARGALGAGPADAAGGADGGREGQEGQRGGQPEQAGEVFVGALLPAAAPDELEDLAEREQVSGGGGRKEVGDAVDRMEGPRGRRVGRKAEERDDAVDVD